DEPKKLVTSPELEAKCQRLFRGLDVNCSGALSVTEVKQAFAEVAPSVSFASIRRRILLTQGSLPTLMSEVKRASEDKDSDSEVEFATGAAGKVQAEKISELLELPTAQVCSFLEALEVKDASGKRKIKLPDDGTDYSLEELAISIFLCKPPDRDLEDLISELPKQDRDKGLSLDEFQRYVIRRTDRHMTLKLAAKSKPKTEAKRASTAVTSKADRSSKPCSLFTSEGYLPAKCTAEQLRVVYEALEQKNPCVSVNALLSSMKNVSDILAIDQRSYQGGERIVCNVRFGSETVPLLGKCPVVAVVPSRMTWAEEQKGWMLDGQKVKTFAQIGSLPTPLPPGSSGVFREAVLWLTAPWGVTEHRGFDVRLFVSDQGRVPLKQVGIPVSFAVHMPSPPAPVLEDVILEPGADSCSALLHWVPPLAATYCPPILKHILHIEPVIPRTQQTLEGGMAGEELDVWNRELRDFEKRRSFKIEHLQRGVPYRFAVQCVHQVPDAASSVKEVLGAQSDFCEAQTMPLQPAPPQPGAPDVRAWHNTGKLEILEVLLPFAEVDSVDRFCRVDIEYRSSGEWQRIPEAQMYLSHEPKWDDRLDSFALSCLLIGLKLETREGLELRARSFNSSGPSSWSPGAQLVLDGKEDEGGADAESAELHILAVEVLKTSAAVLDPKDHLPRNSGASALPRSRTQSRMSSARPSTTESSAKMPRALTQALGVARVSSDCGAPRLEGPRTHCCIQWHMEEGDLHYHVEAREERLPFYAPWAPLPAYFRNQKDEKVAEVFVGGLERFPANESLLLRLVKGSAKRGGVSATVRVPGVMGPPAPPTLQLTRTLTSPGSEQPVVELTWPANKELEKGVGHVIEASWELGDSRTEWATLCTARQMDSANEEANVCFVQLQQPEIKAAGAASQCWLRLRCLGPDGRLGDPSPETDAVQLADAMRSAVAAQEALRRASARKTPRRPQQLTVLGGSKNLWEAAFGTVVERVKSPEKDLRSLKRSPRELQCRWVGLHALRALRTLRSQGELCDVVLAAGEEQVLAHQAILAAASPKLREHILAQNRCLPGERDDDLCLPPEPLEIRLEHMAPAALKALVDQLYGSQVCQSEIAGGLRQLRSEGLLCDILLKVGKERLPAHQVVLAANCSGLRKMLRAKHTLELELNGVSAEAVRILLDFLYGEDRQVPSELCRDLLHLAKELKLPALQERCFAEPKEVCPQQVLEVSSTQEATQEEPPRVLTMRCLRFSSGPVPSPPKDALEAADAAGEIYCKQDVAFLRGLVRLFWERSVWLEPALTQAPLLAKTMDAQRLKRLLPYVAYQWREGPWQQAYARLGFDPREEPEAMKWQVVMFTDKDLPRGPRGRPTGGHKAAEDIWFAQAPANRCQLYQLECIEDECVQSLMQDVEPQKECQLKTGFLDPVLHDAILERLQVRSRELRESNERPRTRARV
ncbi:unnamed protein product, partial [Effrenium voratum]